MILAAVLTAGCILLSGCSGPADPDPARSSTPIAAPSPIESTARATSAVFHGTVQEYADALVQCMVDAGWEASTDADDPQGPGVIRFGTVPAEQQAAWDADNESCQSTLGVLDDAPRTDAELRARYDWLVGLNDCLVAAGYVQEAPPSYESFSDEFATSGTIAWDPMGSVGTASVEAALSACPRSTDVW
ncbi:hypothetical protein IF188_06380 [Microbacterium sp. NEAU-LLC]|uniref:Lipoprotein n=1 Tax=Microbacterium helvum TaxID=2773713 RepID=A0ABR8NKX5_9MICO|nr:hypothetical protein [Microbacterium helvum]MBD3941325.1 hypothetical protein [Microbacterium helvum]